MDEGTRDSDFQESPDIEDTSDHEESDCVEQPSDFEYTSDNEDWSDSKRVKLSDPGPTVQQELSRPMPDLPREIRRLIWRELATIALPAIPVRRHIRLEPQDEYKVISDINDGATVLVALDMHDGDGSNFESKYENPLFRLSVMKASPDLFREVLNDVADRVVFAFYSSINSRFTETLAKHYGEMPQAMPRIRTLWPKQPSRGCGWERDYCIKQDYTINLLFEALGTEDPDEEAHGDQIQVDDYPRDGIISSALESWHFNITKPQYQIAIALEPGTLKQPQKVAIGPGLGDCFKDLKRDLNIPMLWVFD
ncbi:hypothetical protein PFICI_11008 [Pestalotiopsis fici W106-1]|uniref:Uncharacterized protein n=1 Tax=Pestalotiopsis fici (strain W106-1 / CGMCC3.15140) TaxID=1229662 RepID=W3WTJ7_PESFW|nr:uncharacterized protein PFICI_11008 [Pestalotiopsis fici W106-1]ETS77134.1 hypothetical protein PFICI_11008 [Pestalotiopsis fici W106-1]